MSLGFLLLLSVFSLKLSLGNSILASTPFSLPGWDSWWSPWRVPLTYLLILSSLICCPHQLGLRIQRLGRIKTFSSFRSTAFNPISFQLNPRNRFNPDSAVSLRYCWSVSWVSSLDCRRLGSLDRPGLSRVRRIRTIWLSEWRYNWHIRICIHQAEGQCRFSWPTRQQASDRKAVQEGWSWEGHPSWLFSCRVFAYFS